MEQADRGTRAHPVDRYTRLGQNGQFMSRLVLFASDNGILLLAGADQGLGLVGTMAPVIRDHRIPARITHTTPEILRARIFAMHVAELPGCGRSGRSTKGSGLQLNIPWPP
jgi:hypothetical protein